MESKEPTKSKYDEALAKYNTSLDDADVAAQVKAIIEQKVAENDTPEVKKFLFHCIDQKMPQGERLVKLNRIAIQQMQVLESNDERKLLK